MRLDDPIAFAVCLAIASACASPTADTTERDDPLLTRDRPIASEPDDGPLDPPELGIAACDRYIAAFAACIERSAPAPSKPTLREAVRDTVENWRGLAGDAASREYVEHICRDAYAAAATLTREWGCELPPPDQGAHYG